MFNLFPESWLDKFNRLGWPDIKKKLIENSEYEHKIRIEILNLKKKSWSKRNKDSKRNFEAKKAKRITELNNLLELYQAEDRGINFVTRLIDINNERKR